MEPTRQILRPEEPPADATAQPSSLLISAKQAAELCGKSLRTWRSWDAAGWIPRPVRIGRSTLWRVDELRDWDGLPHKLLAVGLVQHFLDVRPVAIFEISRQSDNCDRRGRATEHGS